MIVSYATYVTMIAQILAVLYLCNNPLANAMWQTEGGLIVHVARQRRQVNLLRHASGGAAFSVTKYQR